MTAKATIVATIKARVGSSGYSVWRIGLTHDLADRKKYWSETAKESTTHWTQWQADSLGEAQEIEAAFIKAGMQGGVGGDLSPRKTVYIYIF